MSKVLLGFGGAQLSCAEITAEFPLNKGDISYKEEYKDFKLRSGIYRRIFQGFRPYITLTFHNVDDTSAGEMVNLLSLINIHKNTGELIEIYPRYDFDSAFGVSFQCELVTDIDIQDIGNTAAAQTLELVFRSQTLVTEVSTLVSDTSEFNLVDYEGNTVVDYQDNQIIGVS